MSNKFKIKSYKVNVIYNDKYLFKFIFSTSSIKIENWLNK